MGDQLVYSFDDRVGYGFHGDFFNGWKPGVVESLLDQCTYQTPVICQKGRFANISTWLRESSV